MPSFTFMCSVNCSNSTVGPRGGHGSGGPESTPAGLCIFLSDPDPELESKFCAKPDPDPESIEIFGSSRSLRGLHTCHVLSKNIAEFRFHRWYPESEQESDSQIKKYYRSRTWILIQIFWKMSGVGVWKCDPGHLQVPRSL